MSDFLNNLDKTNCAFVGEGVILRGSMAAAEKLVVLGTVEGQVEARELLVGTNGTIKGNVRVDQAYIQGTILENIEAKVCLWLRRTGRIEGTAVYGEIEVEKGGVLVGQMSEKSPGLDESFSMPPISVAEIRSSIAVSKKEDKAVSF